MPKKPVSSRTLAQKGGISHTLVQRKRRQGRSDDEIVAEATGEAGQTETFWQAQARKEQAIASLRELELAQKRGELVDASETRTAWTSMISEAKASLLNIGDELGDVLAAEANPIRCRELVNGKVREALLALANG